MIFSSASFILVFLPITFFVYFFLNRKRWTDAGKLWLVVMSCVFYSYWNINYLPLLLLSITFNFTLGNAVSPHRGAAGPRYSRKGLLIFAITANLLVLAYYKYTHFLLANIDSLFGLDWHVGAILLPLGISFFTFTQIAFLVDSYQGKATEYDFINYALFVTFFPHLIAGPILHHHEMMTQFKSRWTWAVRYRNVVMGLFIFSIGLFKKVILADSFASWATYGFDTATQLDFIAAWQTSLSYTFQLYFDFSGYCDMAIGASLLFNIWLPINFNSPYKALDIQDFWRRWHITLGRYLRDYLYIPLGGNRVSVPRIYTNIMITFLIGGLWHGASWMFVIWGALHGAALVINRLWRQAGLRLPKALAWLATFLFVNFAWVFFRATTMDDALKVLRGMADIKSLLHPDISRIPTHDLAWAGPLGDVIVKFYPGNLFCLVAIVVAFIVIAQKNAIEMAYSKQSVRLKMVYAYVLMCIGIYATMVSASPAFLYYNF